MSSVVCQGLRSCLKPRQIEPIVLIHKLSPLPQQEDNILDTININEEEDSNNNDKVNKNDELGGWNFLNSLTNPTEKSEKVYVHHVVKSKLSSKSLEMCTESLGSETGSDISESNEELELGSLDQKEGLFAMRKSTRFSKKVATSFPPPLTSISGGSDGGVRVKPHREGGRLVLKAVSVSSCGTNFQAERTNGRLKLSLMIKDCSMKCRTKMAAVMEEEMYAGDDSDYAYNDDENEEGYFVGEDVDGNNENVEGGNGIGEFSRPSRCKEGGGGGGGRNKVISDWRSFWVAIS